MKYSLENCEEAAENIIGRWRNISISVIMRKRGENSGRRKEENIMRNLKKRNLAINLRKWHAEWKRTGNDWVNGIWRQRREWRGGVIQWRGGMVMAISKA